MKKIIKKLIISLILCLTIFVMTSCERSTTTSITTTEENDKVDTSYREDRDLSGFSLPSDELDEENLPKISESIGEIVTLTNDSLALVNNGYRLEFVNESGKYYPQTVSLKSIGKTDLASSGDVMFVNAEPVKVYLGGSATSIISTYDSIETTDYGIKAIASLISDNGSIVEVTDCYYIAKENEKGTFNIRQQVLIKESNINDTGFASEYSFKSANQNNSEWFVPNVIYKTTNTSSAIYKETGLGAPMIMMRDTKTGYTLSLARYQPVITYENNCYATLEMDNKNKEITVAYPSNEANRKYHTSTDGAKHVYDLCIRVEVTDSYDEAMSSFYNAEFNLQNQRIVNTDIDEVYKVINEDYKTFLHSEEQVNEETGKKYTSYGLPWRITIEDGEFGPYTYQAGFIGQQIPSAYNMMLYGIMNDDLESLQNGINVIDFWVEDAEFMSIAGVPHIWYDTWSDDFRAYPCFLRMAIDAMEGLLDAYRLAVAHGIKKDSWKEALDLFGEFLINNQNEDGSYYRCYNYSGGPFENWDDGIEEPIGNICQSTSKSSSLMPVRFLAKMYEMTKNKSYYDAALNAGEYAYKNLYTIGSYSGGTCDNPNRTDKEAGVYAMYAYDSLYTLTGDSKWLACLKQAAAFTMSTVLIVSYPVRASSLKSAYALYSGYNDGMSFVTCGYGDGLDNYAAFIYYELFRIYIYTGEKTYLKQAEFIQQNTKSIMNWDGTLNYKYKSLVAEASSITSFNYSSASDGAWVTWSSFANADPISKMYCNFGSADVMDYSLTDIEMLRSILSEVGCGGYAHHVFSNTIVANIE